MGTSTGAGRRALSLVVIAVGFAAAAVGTGLPADGGTAPPTAIDTPVLTARVGQEPATVRGGWKFQTESRQRQRTLVVVRSDGTEVLRREKASRLGSWKDTAALPGSADYRAQVYIDGVAQGWGPWVPVGGPSATTTSSTTTPGSHPTPCSNQVEEQVLTLMNAERRDAGLAELPRDERLVTAAHNDAVYNDARMRAGQGLSHDREDEFVAAAGYPRWAGANLGWGYSTPGSVFTAWMNSGGHRAHILNPRHRNAGVGCVISASGTLTWALMAGY